MFYNGICVEEDTDHITPAGVVVLTATVMGGNPNGLNQPLFFYSVQPVSVALNSKLAKGMAGTVDQFNHA